ncbi:hypothetical protein [Lysinibacillus fusiformis]|uniref:Uncharacterized protein n=1 Tax=Lysinibacillus fusiformis TaxID=28031 RepID=A0A1H9QMM0_9BACI|nr:hypothetical protein [Lysinibacillus fusiformis]SCY78192.1 hypothetical protein SAMN02787081_04317 [Lysinibacillus fusiformis]SEO38411.1 hypothetical protein SAMN02787103_04275 [Lysinibacillus fusiformis]SER61099.1 hypothetical protein SAMN02787113_04199 [Lysinibacillus fusiformis]
MAIAELSNIEIRNLLLETLSYDQEDLNEDAHTFEKHYYRGNQSDLFRLFNCLLIKKGLRSNNETLHRFGWGSSMSSLRENDNISLNKNEISKLYQEFNNLIMHGVIAPGAYGNWGESLPSFHVTEYGLECIKKIEILPYDQENYLKKLLEIEGIDEWVGFYVTEALQCFNANCINSAMINIGLAGEVLVEKLISNFEAFLIKNDTTLAAKYHNETKDIRSISEKYLKYVKYRKECSKKYEDLKALLPKLDNPSSDIYATFTRLTRNTVAHPNEIKMDRIKVLMFFLTFVDYCELQYLFINYYKSKSED